MKSVTSRASAVAAALVVLGFAGVARAVQFPSLSPGYTQEIFTGPLQPGEGGFAWTSSGALLTKRGSNIVEYALVQTPNLHQGTSAHAVVTTHPIAGLNPGGVGLTNGLDGYIYAVTTLGLQRFDPSNWSAPAQSLTGTAGGGGYGMTTLPDGRIAYTDSSGSGSNVYVYTPNANPTLGTNLLVYTAPAGVLIDGMQAGPTGALALAGQTDKSLRVISSAGAPIATITGLAHYPDGLAFSSSSASGRIYSNNNDGTITRYDLGPGYTGTPVITDIATGAGAYGDIAAVGPDCMFYVSQYENGSYHGATPGVGTNWDNAVTTAEASYTRIGALTLNADGSVSPTCDFYSPLVKVPEPGMAGLLLAATAVLVGSRRRGRRGA